MALIFVDTRQVGDPTSKDAVACELERLATEQFSALPEFPHSRFWVIERLNGKQLGHFMCFSINGESHCIDASVPTHLDRLPGDAVEVTGELREKILHCNCGSHVWGCCYFEEVKQIIKPSRRGKRRFSHHDRFPPGALHR